ncbi:MAG TPA: hypothetical protein VGA04_23350 [Streptosporangiaceae bacterium]
MAGMSGIPRSRGAFSGVMLILLGAWGGLIPFVGPYLHYAYTPPNTAWHFTLARLWLEILPGAAVVLGGVLVTLSASRLIAGGGAILAALGGGWFVVGREVNRLWPHLGVPGAPAGFSVTRRVVEELGFFTGLGVVIVFFAALALGRCSVAVSQDAGAAADDGGFPVGAGSDPAATAGFPASTVVPPANSGRFPDHMADPPEGSSHYPYPPGDDAPAGRDWAAGPSPAPDLTAGWAARPGGTPPGGYRPTA